MKAIALVSLLLMPSAAFAQQDPGAALRSLQDICLRHYQKVGKGAVWEPGFDGKNAGDVDCNSIMLQKGSDLNAAKSLAKTLGGLKN